MTMVTCDTQPANAWFGEKPSRLRSAATWGACRVAAALQSVRGNRCNDGFAILMYHRCAEEVPGVETPTINVTPRQFRRQLVGLLASGFECWSLSKLIEAHRESRTIPPNVFAITFDDGYENNFSNAWPILRELNLPATIFVATKYLDSDRPFPFDDWQATGSSRVPASAWRPLSTRQCEELLDGGLVDLGAHTHSHRRFLGRCQDFRADMRLCLDVLRDRFGVERPAFAFPYGDASQELADAAKQLGVVCSLTTRSRRVLPGSDEYQWGRFWAADEDTPAVLSAKLSGWYTTVAMACKAMATPWAGLDRPASRPNGSQLCGTLQGDMSRAREESTSP
jgi:peptidoglycan/xylan/chitin deacetylase (PgdA/CDA1 family)